jgi:gamma-glutamylaminecyclotransferase
MPRSKDKEMEPFEKDLLQSIAEMKRGEFASRMPNLVFVFGTLKEGYPNFATNRGRRIPGDFVTRERYPLYLMGERFSPWLVFLPGEGERVVGQLFEVDDAVLAAMDLLERVSEADGYRRVPIGVEGVGEASGSPRIVHAYVKPPEQFDGAQARLGPLTEYTMAHAGLYRSRSAMP